jgi:hypothetical protein
MVSVRYYSLINVKGIYYASHWITFFILYVLSTIIFVAAGWSSDLELFTQVIYL